MNLETSPELDLDEAKLLASESYSILMNKTIRIANIKECNSLNTMHQKNIKFVQR